MPSEILVQFSIDKLTSKIPSSLPSFPFTPACTHMKKTNQSIPSITFPTQCCISPVLFFNEVHRHLLTLTKLNKNTHTAGARSENV